MKFEQVTEYIWESEITNKGNLRCGWEKYRIVFNGTNYSLSMTMDLGGQMKMYSMARGVESLDKAKEIIIDYDGDNSGDMPPWACWILGLMFIGICLIFYFGYN